MSAEAALSRPCRRTNACMLRIPFLCLLGNAHFFVTLQALLEFDRSVHRDTRAQLLIAAKSAGLNGSLQVFSFSFVPVFFLGAAAHRQKVCRAQRLVAGARKGGTLPRRSYGLALAHALAHSPRIRGFVRIASHTLFIIYPILVMSHPKP